MKVLFSICNEDHETGIVTFIDSLLVQTDWSFEQIDNHIALYDGFRSEVTIGDRISFFDFYCFFDDSSSLVEKIKTIPSSNLEEPQLRTPSVFRVSEYDPGDTVGQEYPNTKRCYLYNLERYECGASGYEAIVHWAATHPVEMIFVAGVIYDSVKWLISKILVCLKLKRNSTAICPVILNTKKLYQNFSKATKVSVHDCQITKFYRLRAGIFHAQIRTITGRKFKLKCSAGGEIESLEDIT